MENVNRRRFVKHAAIAAGGAVLGLTKTSPISFAEEAADVLAGVQSFLHQVAHEDGSFRPGMEPTYQGYSDTYYSGVAAPVYAVLVCETFGWPLPHPEATKKYFLSLQRSDGAFYPRSGAFDPDSPQARLYNTAQSLVALRFLGEKARYDPSPIVEYFFDGEVFKKLPLYTTSFFPYFYAASGKPMPKEFDQRLRAYIEGEQREDGYLGDHVASTFHAAHYYRLIGAPVPKAKAMVERVLRDQQNDGSWCLHPPDWDVHAVFDALFILRQLGDPGDPRIKKAYQKATEWVLKCRNRDGGFGHFPSYTSDMDAIYFQVGALTQAGYLKPRNDLRHEEILGWGHVMVPGKQYACL